MSNHHHHIARVARTATRLHFLWATGWRVKDGTRIGSYVIHFHDGQELEMPIVYGDDVRDWVRTGDPGYRLRSARVVLSRPDLPSRLFTRVWENPRPSVQILSLDFKSSMTECAPFILAITAE